MSYPHLFAPGRIANLELPNRIVKSPQTTATSNPDGTVTQRTIDHYKRLGEGGTGLVMVEYTYVDEDASKSIHGQTGLSRRDHVAGMGWLADEVKSTGARVGIQLVHCGRQRFLGTEPMKSATNSSWDHAEAQHGVVPTPMTIEEIHAVVKSFGEAAMRAYHARFDLVEVHAGHGYLLTNFLSPHTNWRTDEYGGSPENRSRIVLEVIEEIRRQVPRDFPLSVRLSVTDYEPDGIQIEDTVALCLELEKRGVDVIHASGGHHAKQEWEASSWFMPRQPHRWGWEQIKAAITIPVIASGSLIKPEIAEDILASGSADFASLGRAMMADPYWPQKAKEGRSAEITPCIRCNDGCLWRGLDAHRSTGCTVNPTMGMEKSFPIEITPAPKTYAVIGGGPAGLKAAAILHDRGHQVTLFEQARLGGLLTHAEGAMVKQDLADLATHMVHEVQRRGIRVVGEAASATSLRGAGFTRAVVATGAADRHFEGPVADGIRVVKAQDVHPADVQGARVGVIGGGFQGSDAALRLIEQAEAVTLLERGESLMRGDEVIYDVMVLPQRLEEAGVVSCLGAEASAIEADGVRRADGQLVPADVVVLALGRERAPGFLQDELTAVGVEVTVVGSAQKPGRVFDAIHSAFFACRLL